MDDVQRFLREFRDTDKAENVAIQEWLQSEPGAVELQLTRFLSQANLREWRKLQAVVRRHRSLPPEARSPLPAFIEDWAFGVAGGEIDPPRPGKSGARRKTLRDEVIVAAVRWYLEEGLEREQAFFNVGDAVGISTTSVRRDVWGKRKQRGLRKIKLIFS